MDWHFPRLRKLPSILFGIVSLLISLTPDSAIENTRAFIEFLGFQPAGWLQAATLSPIARPLALILSISLFAWGCWPERKAEATRPRRGWIKLSDAPFELPRRQLYSSITPLWTPVLLQHSLPGGEGPIGFTIAGRLSAVDASTIDGIPLTDPAIVWNLRRFRLAWDAGDTYHMTSFHPWDAEKAPRPEYMSQETWDLIREQSALSWSLFTRGLADVIKAGKVRIWARSKSATAPFTLLSPDAWVHYRVTDWPSGRAVGEGDDRLFSIYVETLEPLGQGAFPYD